ncbi:hypothetical protein MY3957_005436 [Beauveria namnaoensis]
MPKSKLVDGSAFIFKDTVRFFATPTATTTESLKGPRKRTHRTSRGSRCERKGRSRSQSRVQKSVSVSRRQAYAFERLGAARQATGGIIEYQFYWEPTWLPIGDDVVQEAKDWVVAVFGSDTWHKEAGKLGLI